VAAGPGVGDVGSSVLGAGSPVWDVGVGAGVVVEVGVAVARMRGAGAAVVTA